MTRQVIGFLNESSSNLQKDHYNDQELIFQRPKFLQKLPQLCPVVYIIS